MLICITLLHSQPSFFLNFIFQMFFVFKKVRKRASHSGGKEYSHLAVESIRFWQVLWLRFGLSVSRRGSCTKIQPPLWSIRRVIRSRTWRGLGLDKVIWAEPHHFILWLYKDGDLKRSRHALSLSCAAWYCLRTLPAGQPWPHNLLGSEESWANINVLFKLT